LVAFAPPRADGERFAAGLLGSRAMKRSGLQSLLLLIVTVLVCLGGAEVFFRLFPQFLDEETQLRLHWQEIARSEAAEGIDVPDPRLGYRLRPHFTGRTTRGHLDFTFHTDEHGFRNPSPWPEQADVVVVGDSLAFSYGVNDDQAWPRLVAKALPGTRIITLGVPGFGPQQYLRALEAFGLGLHPKLVLFMLFSGNDLGDAERFQSWLDADTKLTYREWRANLQSSGDDTWRGLLERSRLVNFLQGVRRSLRARIEDSTIKFAEGGRVQLAPSMLLPNIERAHPGDPAFSLVLATIERARAITRQHGSEFLVLLMPTKEEVYLPRIGEPAPPLAEALRAELERRGIRLLDLTPDLQAHDRDPAPLFYEVDGHPNAHGYRLIASVIAEHLKASDLVDGRFEQMGSASPSNPRDTGRRTF
jgi:lysophospholipase L1-like esterase